jgi:(2Fe-2S) ferredoxin
VEVYEEGKPLVVYGNMNQERAKRVVVEHVVNGNPVTEFALEVM